MTLIMQVLYALTAGVAGYVASLCFKVMGGTDWVRNVLLTTALFCGPMLACFSFLNTVAIIYRVSLHSNLPLLSGVLKCFCART
jgi:hypothetical protein